MQVITYCYYCFVKFKRRPLELKRTVDDLQEKLVQAEELILRLSDIPACSQTQEESDETKTQDVESKCFIIIKKLLVSLAYQCDIFGCRVCSSYKNSGPATGTQRVLRAD
jgi:hypothetical protein